MRLQTTLMTLASIIIIFAGLKAANSVVVPFLLATFIAIVTSPVLDALEKIKIPRTISFIFVAFLLLGFLAFIGSVAVTTMFDFLGQLPEFNKKFQVLLSEWMEKLNNTDFRDMIVFDPNMFNLESNKIITTTSSLVRKTGSMMSMWLFILLLVAFMLFETRVMQEKVKYLSRKYSNAVVFVNSFVYNLKRYLFIKTIVSVATGLIIGFGLYYLGIPYAVLWGIVAFIMNYIPTIGSFVAAVPAVFVALISGNFSDTIWVVVLYIATNTIFGVILEPRLVGEELGISTITVLFSLLLWGYVLGMGGLFLAVPLTMTIQIALKINPKTEFIAVMLSNKAEK